MSKTLPSPGYRTACGVTLVCSVSIGPDLARSPAERWESTTAGSSATAGYESSWASPSTVSRWNDPEP